MRNRANNPFSFAEKILPYFKVHHSLINDANNLEELHDEYIEFQAMPDTDIPENIWKDAEIGKNVSQQSKRKPDIRMDIIWGYLRQRFPTLASVALTVLDVCIPHSNAAEERIFSIIGRNNNKFRSTLQLDGSVNAIMRVKMAYPEALIPCHAWTPSRVLLLKCKRATTKYNEEHASSSQ